MEVIAIYILDLTMTGFNCCVDYVVGFKVGCSDMKSIFMHTQYTDLSIFTDSVIPKGPSLCRQHKPLDKDPFNFLIFL